MFCEIVTSHKRAVFIFICLLVMNLNVFSQVQRASESQLRDSAITIVEKVVVRFDFSKPITNRRAVYKDSANLAKMDYLYNQLHSDTDLRLRIDVYSYTMNGTIGFDVTYFGAKDLCAYLSRKGLSLLDPDFFESMQRIELTQEQIKNEGDESLSRVEFILFK